MWFQLSAELLALLVLGVFFLMLYNLAVDYLQYCSLLERIPVGKRRCVQNVTFIQAKEFVYFVNLCAVYPFTFTSVAPCFLLAVGNNRTSSVLHETSYFGSWLAWALVSDSSIFCQVFIFLAFL